eukprot:TRINITY_DN3847_c0_g5_i1.p1 TRINITY_DN3847_c0_g5~~TRINITY_DN3847_c0_g5_i1.p1  ORF type:complete len:289 (+),score=65.72 TRINITY_DN3847_c0_g5_i1:61-867(+)
MQFKEYPLRDIKKVRFQKTDEKEATPASVRKPRQTKKKTCEMGTDTSDQAGSSLPLPRKKGQRAKEYDIDKGRWKVGSLLEAAAKLKYKDGGDMKKSTALYLIQKSGATMEDLLYTCLGMDCPVPASIGECCESLEGGVRMADETLIDEAVSAVETLDSQQYQDCLYDLLIELLKWSTLTTDSFDDESESISRLIAVFSMIFTSAFLFCVIWVLLHSEKRTFPEAYDAMFQSALEQSERFLRVIGNLTGVSLVNEDLVSGNDKAWIGD